MIGGVDHSGGGDWGCELRVPGGGVGPCWVGGGKIRMMFNFFRLHHVACGILFSCQGLNPASPGVGSADSNHWTVRSPGLHSFSDVLP